MVKDVKDIRCEIKIRLTDASGTPFMGVGLVWLLERIDTLKSISKAAEDMSLSYPKALRMLADLEGALGQAAVLRHKGGSLRGGAELTAAGRILLEEFRSFRDRVQVQAEALFEGEYRDRIFTRLLPPGDQAR